MDHEADSSRRLAESDLGRDGPRWLELHELDLRYEALRRRAPEQEKRLLASLAQHGQQAPVVVVGSESGRAVVVDGYKRLRALRKLKADTVLVTSWKLAEAEALMLERLMRTAGRDDAFEQAWLLRELGQRFALSQEQLARRFDKSTSWVCRRLALVAQLPEEIQERVRRGEIVAHAAMKYLVPLARANRAASLRLVAALAKSHPSSRQIGALYGAWLSGNAKTRELLLSDPWLYFRAQEQARHAQKLEQGPAQQLLSDLGALGGISRRACSKLRQGLARKLLPPERDETHRCLRQAKADADALFLLGQQELGDARPETEGGHPRPS
jgi:ParB/RepB/Spo0J family partition protein